MKKYCQHRSDIGMGTIVKENGKICNIFLGQEPIGEMGTTPVLGRR